jgi:hypothetical protein
MNNITKVCHRITVYVSIGMVLWSSTITPAMSQFSIQKILTSAYQPLMQKALPHVGPLALGSLLGAVFYAYRNYQGKYEVALREYIKQNTVAKSQLEKDLEGQKSKCLIRSRFLLARTEVGDYITENDLTPDILIREPDKDLQAWYRKKTVEISLQEAQDNRGDTYYCYVTPAYVLSQNLRKADGSSVCISLRGSAWKDLQDKLTRNVQITERDQLLPALQELPEIAVKTLLARYQDAYEAHNFPSLKDIGKQIESAKTARKQDLTKEFSTNNYLKYSALGAATMYGAAQLFLRLRA